MAIIKFISFLGFSFLLYFIYIHIIKLLFKKEKFTNFVMTFILSTIGIFLLSSILGGFIQEIQYMFALPIYVWILSIFSIFILTYIFFKFFKTKFLKTSISIILKIFIFLVISLGIYLSTLYITFFENIYTSISSIYKLPIIGILLSLLGYVLLLKYIFKIKSWKIKK